LKQQIEMDIKLKFLFCTAQNYYENRRFIFFSYQVLASVLHTNYLHFSCRKVKNCKNGKNNLWSCKEKSLVSKVKDCGWATKENNLGQFPLKVTVTRE
jgi:hypothetical protein